MGDNGRFQIGLGVAGLFFEAEELQNIGFLDEVLRAGDKLALPRKLTDTLFVTAQSQPLIETGIELPLEFAQSPTLLSRFNLVKSRSSGLSVIRKT